MAACETESYQCEEADWLCSTGTEALRFKRSSVGACAGTEPEWQQCAVAAEAAFCRATLLRQRSGLLNYRTCTYSSAPLPPSPPGPANMLRSRVDQGDELEPLNPRHPDSLAASPSRTPTPSPASKRPRPSPLHGISGGANGDPPHGAAALLPEYLEGLRPEGGGAQPRPLPLWQLLLAGGLLLTVALVAVDYEMEVCMRCPCRTPGFALLHALSAMSPSPTCECGCSCLLGRHCR